MAWNTCRYCGTSTNGYDKTRRHLFENHPLEEQQEEIARLELAITTEARTRDEAQELFRFMASQTFPVVAAIVRGHLERYHYHAFGSFEKTPLDAGRCQARHEDVIAHCKEMIVVAQAKVAALSTPTSVLAGG